MPTTVMSPEQAVARPGRLVRVRTEVAALPKTFDYVVPPEWRHDVEVGTRVRVPSPRPHRAGLGRRVRRGPGRRRRSLAPQVVARVGSAARAGPARRLGGLALVGAGVVLPGGWHHPPRSCATLPVARRRDVGPPERGATERRPGLDLGTTLTEPDATMVRLPPVTDLIDLVLSVVDDPAVRGRDGSTVVLVPSTGWAERLTARLVRRGYPTTAAWAEARAGWPVVVASRVGCLGPGAAAGRRGRARRARRRLPGGERAHLQRGRGAARTSRPGGCPVHPRVAGAARRPGGTGRAAHGDAPGPSGAAGLAGARTGGPPGRRPAHGHVLRGVRATGPVGPGRSTRPRPAGPWSACTTGRAAPVCWPAGTAGSWPAVPAAVPRRPGRGTRRCCCARAAARRARSSASRAGACA